MNIGLRPNELKRMFKFNTGKQLPVLHYNDIISESKQARDLFEDSIPYLIIYYPQIKINNRSFGHFCALIKGQTPAGKEIISFYDPMGNTIDSYKQHSPQREELYDEEYNTLVWWLLKYRNEGAVIEDNHHKHQSPAKEVATCGRHCMIRCIYHFLDNSNYHKFLRGVQASGYLDKWVYQQTKHWGAGK